MKKKNNNNYIGRFIKNNKVKILQKYNQTINVKPTIKLYYKLTVLSFPNYK